MTRLRQIVRCRRGGAAVEMAFILPLLLMVVLGAMEFGRFAWTRTGLTFAVLEAARCAAVRPDVCRDSASTGEFAAAKIKGLGVPASAFTLTRESCGARVRAEFAYRSIIRPILPDGTRLKAEVCRA